MEALAVALGQPLKQRHVEAPLLKLVMVKLRAELLVIPCRSHNTHNVESSIHGSNINHDFLTPERDVVVAWLFKSRIYTSMSVCIVPNWMRCWRAGLATAAMS